MNKQINNKYAIIILVVIIVLCSIFGFFIVDISAYKNTIKYITNEYKQIYITNYDLEIQNQELRKQNLYLREENVSLGKKLEKLKGEIK